MASLTEKQKQILTNLKNKIPFKGGVSHITIRRLGGGNDGYLHFDITEEDQLTAVAEYVRQLLEYKNEHC